MLAEIIMATLLSNPLMVCESGRIKIVRIILSGSWQKIVKSGQPRKYPNCHFSRQFFLHFPTTASQWSHSLYCREHIMIRTTLLSVLLLLSFTLSSTGQPKEKLYTEGKHGQGELKYINRIPVLILAGSPQEMGEQGGALTPGRSSTCSPLPTNSRSNSA